MNELHLKKHEKTVREVMALLVRVANSSVQSFLYFPDVILAAGKRLEPEDFYFLVNEDFIEEYKVDSFGKFYRLSIKAEEFITNTLAAKHRLQRRKVQKAFFQTSFAFA